MARLPKSPVLSLCLIAVAGFGTYVPLEKLHSAQIEAASQPLAINAVLSDLQSRSEDEALPKANATARLILEGEERVFDTNVDLTDLTDKSL